MQKMSIGEFQIIILRFFSIFILLTQCVCVCVCVCPAGRPLHIVFAFYVTLMVFQNVIVVIE